MPQATKPVRAQGWERVNFSLPKGLKGPARTHAKNLYRNTRAATLSGLATVLLLRELQSKKRLSFEEITGL